MRLVPGVAPHEAVADQAALFLDQAGGPFADPRGPDPFDPARAPAADPFALCLFVDDFEVADAAARGVHVDRLPLKPGKYRLVGRTGVTSKTARFTILR